MTLYDIGSQVLIRGLVEGQITAITIEDGANITYRVAYWNGQKLENDWMPSLVLTFGPEARTRVVGFRSEK